MDSAEVYGGFDFESFRDNLVRMVRAGEDLDTRYAFRDIALEMLKKLDTDELEGLAHEILKRRAMNCGNEDESVREALEDAERFRRRAVIVRAQKVLAEEEGVDWKSVGMHTNLDYRSADMDSGCSYIEIDTSIRGLEDPDGFVALFENREPKNIRVTKGVNNSVRICVPLDYVMHKERVSEEKSKESSVVAQTVEEIRAEDKGHVFWR